MVGEELARGPVCVFRVRRLGSARLGSEQRGEARCESQCAAAAVGGPGSGARLRRTLNGPGCELRLAAWLVLV